MSHARDHVEEMSFLGCLLKRGNWSRQLSLIKRAKYPPACNLVKIFRVQFSLNALKHGQPLNAASDHVTPSLRTSDTLKCVGCGSVIQTIDSDRFGYVIPRVFNAYTTKTSLPSTETVDDVTTEESASLICQRCHNLKHYNTAMNITSNVDDYKKHLVSLQEKRALVILIVDAIDFPGSLFPDLDSILGQRNYVHVVVNKVDLLPNLNRKTLQRLEEYIRSEFTNSLRSHDIHKMWFVSSKTGKGIDNLCNEIAYSWGNRGDVYLLGCTNVGKSSLFNHLITNLCAALPGDQDTVSGLSAPTPVVSHWPGTTLGLISFPILSVGKRRRLLEQVHKAPRDMVDKSLGNEGLRIRELYNAKKVYTSNPGVYECLPDISDILDEIGIRKPQKNITAPKKEQKIIEEVPKNRIWLHDTPGAINSVQVCVH